jgi:hypothetical protein
LDRVIRRSSNNSAEAMEKIVSRLITDLRILIQSFLGRDFIEGVFVPSVAASLYIEQLSAFMDKFSLVSSDNLSEVFSLYSRIRELEELVSDIDHEIVKEIRTADWFYPYILKWLELNGKQARCNL